MVGNVTFQLLSRLGVRTIQTLSETPVEVLHQLIGKNGTELWKKPMELMILRLFPIQKENQYPQKTLFLRTPSMFRILEVFYREWLSNWLSSYVRKNGSLQRSLSRSDIPISIRRPNSVEFLIPQQTILCLNTCSNFLKKSTPEECEYV